MNDSREIPQPVAKLLAGVDPERGLDPGEMLELLEGILAETAVAGFEVAMVGAGQSRQYRGIEGLREAMGDWISPYTDYSVFLEAMREAPAGFLVPVRQVGRTRHGGVEVENLGATVIKVEDGRVVRIEFHLDRDVAERSAAEGGQSSQA